MDVGTSLSITDKIPAQRHSGMCTGAANVLMNPWGLVDTHILMIRVWSGILDSTFLTTVQGARFCKSIGHPLRGQSSVCEQHGQISSPKVIFFPKLTKISRLDIFIFLGKPCNSVSLCFLDWPWDFSVIFMILYSLIRGSTAMNNATSVN